MKKIFTLFTASLLFVCFYDIQCIGQSGQVGVGNRAVASNHAVWSKADAGTSEGSNGRPMSGWLDQSGRGSEGSQSFTPIDQASVTAKPSSWSEGFYTPPYFSSPPTITSFSPASGAIGSTINISGSNFNTTAAGNIVYFGAVKATVTASSSNSITVTIPAGATYGPITVLNTATGLSAQTGYFSPVYSPNKSTIASTDFATRQDFRTGASWAMTSAQGDLDGDGKPDAVLCDYNTTNLYVYPNTTATGSSTFSMGTPLILSTISSSRGIALSDVDGDGKLDILIVGSGSNYVSVYRNTSSGVGNFSFAARTDLGLGGTAYTVVTADIDGDGKLDIITSANNSVNIFKNNSVPGTLSFAARVDFTLPTSGIGSAIGVGVGDMDGDGKPDVVTSQAYVPANQAVSVLLNTTPTGGTISFATRADITGSNGNSGYLSLGDFDGDGKLDIVTGNGNDGNISIFRNNCSSGTVLFDTRVNFATNGSNLRNCVGDINGDGKLDIFQSDNGYVAVFRNTGLPGAGSITSASFAARLNLTGSGAGIWDASLTDMNSDGMLDLVFTATPFIDIYRNAPVIPPVVTPSGTLTAFAACTGTPSSTQSFTVSGSSLTANLVVTAPANYELSLSSAGTYSGTVGLTPTGGSVSSTTIYVRLTGSGSGAQSGNIAVTSTGATAQNVAVSGTVSAVPSATVTADGPTTICTGGSVTLTAPAGYSYLWSNGATTQSINVTNSGTFQVAVSSANCSASSSPITVTLSSSPVLNAIVGPAAVCNNTVTAYNSPAATGGTITYAGGYEIHTFTTGGTFTPQFSGTVEVLVVAGGGAGGGTSGPTSGGHYNGGGGGAGGVLQSSSYTVALNTGVPVTIGAGGASVTSGNGNNGQNSVFGTLTAIGGGGGGRYGSVGNNGGSGGGNGRDNNATPAQGTAGQGNAGSNGDSGGGGGAGSAASGLNGGTGIQSSISGSAVFYAGGGGGSGASTQGGNGGNGGGGAGRNSYFFPGTGTAGTANTGGGGGAAGVGYATGAGGSGIVIVRFLQPAGTWTSSNTSVATISTTGALTASSAGSTTLTYSQTNAAGCSSSVTSVVTVNPIPAATISGNASVCLNSTSPVVTFTGSNGTAPYTFTYTLNGGSQQTITSSGNTAIIHAPTGTAGTFTYALVSVKDASSTQCSASASGSAVVMVSANNTISLSSAAGTNAQTVCNNTAITTITYSTSGATGATFAGLPAGVTGSWTGNVVTISGTPTIAGIYNYTVTLSGGCGSASINGTITVNSLPGASINGTTAVCQNASAPAIVLTGSNGTAPYTFTYTINGGSQQTVTSSGGTATISAPTGAAGTFTYALVSVKDASSTQCSASAAGSAVITVSATNSISLSSAAGTNVQAVCNNAAITNITYNTSGAAGATFSGLPAGVTGSWTGNVVTISGTPSAAGTYNFTVTLTGGCGAVAANGTITVNGLPSASISGTTAVCQNAAAPAITFTGSNGSAPYTFTYTINGGSQQTVTSSGNTATVTVPTGTAGTYNYALVSVKDGSSTFCSATVSGSATVTVNPSPVASVSGTTTLCQNAASPVITFTGGNATAPYTFTYTINGGSQQTVTSSGNTATVTVPTAASGTFIYMLVSVKDADATTCTAAASGSATVIVNALPLPVITASGPTTICANSSVSLSAGSNALTFSSGKYVEVPNNTSLNVGTSTDFTYEALVKLNGSQGNYAGIVVKGSGGPFAQLVIVNNHIAAEIYSTSLVGTGNGLEGSVNLNDNQWHHLAMSVSRSANNCKLYVDGVLAANVTNSLIGGNLDNTSSLLIGVERTKGIYFNGSIDEVRIWNVARTQAQIQASMNATVPVNSSGLVAYYKLDEGSGSATADATVNNHPGTLINSPTWLVPSTSPVSSGFVSYSWSNGASGSSITPASSGNYSVTVTDGNGCTNTSAPVSVTINPLPAASISGTATVCAGGSSPAITFTGSNATAPYTFSYTINGGTVQTVTSVGNSATVSAPTGTAGTFLYTLVSVKDASSTQCSVTVSGSATITVNSAPVFTTCPSNQSANNALGQCSATVNYTATASGTPAPSLTYSFSGATSGSGTGTGSGQSFNVGVTNVTISATNACGSVNCSFTITVQDVTAPSIVCAGNITQNTDPNLCTANVVVSTPTVSDNCNVAGRSVINFDGTNDYVSIAHNNILEPANFTAEAWVYPTGGAQYKCIFGKRTPSSGWNLFINSGNGLELWNGWSQVINGPVIAFNSWTHVAVTENGSGQKLYVNGVLVGSTGANYSPSGAVANFTVGVNTDGFAPWFFGGSMKDIRFWNAAKTAAQITAGMSISYTSPQSNLVMNFPANQGTGGGNNSGITTLNDLSGNNLNGTFVNFAMTGNTSNFIQDPSTASPVSLTNSFNGTSNASGVYPLGTTTIVWTARDIAGNISTCSQTVTVVDNTPPTISCPSNISVTATSAAGAVVNYTTPVGTDNCSGATTVRTAGLASGSSFPIGTTTVKHTVTDGAGLTAQCSFTVTVTGLAPSIIIPSNITVNNSPGQNGANVSFAATETTGIPSSTITYSSAPGSFFPVGTTTVTATATNAVGVSGGHFTVTVIDNEFPVLSGVPANTTVECNAVPAPATVTASDNATTSAPVYTEVRTNGNCPNNYILTRTWSTTDASGNTTTASQTITVRDTQAPQLSAAPANVTVACSAIPAAAVLNATDNCDAAPVVIYTETSTQDADVTHLEHYNYIITRTWTATDACGNSSTKTQVITVHDIIAPEISCPAPVTVNCQDDHSSMSTGAATATDNCTPVANIVITQSDVSTYNADPSNILHYNYTITRTWRATDVAGNYSECAQVITVQDVTKPTITCPANVTINCQDDHSSAATGVATATDNCAAGANIAITQSDVSTYSADPSNALHYNYVITRTWRASDIAGNFSEGIQTITVQDVTKPVIACPGDVTVNCQDDHSSTATGVATATDNCAGSGNIVVTQNDVSTYSSDPSNALHYNYTIARTWRATDVVGNFSECVQTITVLDRIKPVITCPGSITVNCQDDHSSTATGLATATDNCSGPGNIQITQTDVSTYSSIASDPTHYNYTITRTWRATDVVGNFSECTQIITVQDTTRPVFTHIPANVTVECDAVPTPEAMAASDNCDPTPVVLYNEHRTDGSAPGNYILTRTWSATDVSGNVTTVTQVITVCDTKAPVPVISVLPTITGECSAGVTAPTAADNCAGMITATTADPLNYSVQGTYTIHWAYDDGNGNTSAQTQIVIVKDVTPAVITTPVSISVNNDADKCGAAIVITPPVATDNCVVVSTTGTRSDGLALTDIYPVGTTEITWKVTDIGGNVSTASQSVIVTDAQKPVILHLPANITVNALANNCSTLATWTAPTATDNCGIASIVSSDPWFDMFGFTLLPVGINTITYTVTDIHGNQSIASFTVTVVDNQAPIITGCPGNITVSAAQGRCDQVVNWNPPTASDNCPGVSMATNHMSGETFPLGTTTVTYIATDHSGLTSTCSFTVTVTDNQKPILHGVPADVTAECSSVPGVATVTASDNCTLELPVNFTETRTDGNCPNRYTLTRTWSATDASGNVATGIQVITVQDTQAPVLSAAPANVTVECDAVPAPAVLTATDNCDTPVVTYKEVRTNGNCPNNYTLTRTWTATDACGNTSSKTQVITVQDTQAPVLSAAPANVTVECDAVPAPTVLTATDNCDTPVVTYKEVRTNGNCPNNYTLTRTWTATDACGNVSSKTQVIAVQDTQAPVLSAAPANVTVECDAVPAPAVLTATDNCDAPVVTYKEVRTNGNCPSNYTLTRTWTATDACGNTSSKIQVITVQDTQAPVLSAAPANVTVECDAVPTPAVLTATDNCDVPVVTYKEVRTNGNCPSNYTLTRTWTATDACGNVSSKTQVITVQDTQAPVLSAAPANVTVECDAVPAPAVLTATDNCDTPVVTYAEVKTNGNCPNNYTLIRTWTATDACGNTSSKTQVITVQDTQAPVLSAAPANVTVECDAVPAPAVLTATDNCDTPVVTYKEVRTNGNCPSNYTLTRTWTATDACGNASSKTQVINVQDTQAPVLSAAPANVTVECDAVPAPAVLTATDNCDVPVVTYKEVRTNGNCPNNYTLTRTWTATDACGNTSSKTQVITVQDTQAPVLSAVPANVTVECDAVPAPAILTATDNCDTPVVTYKEVRTNGNCPSNYTLTRTWTATDACGNASSKTQVITVQDTQAPVLSAAPANVTVECDAVPAPAILTATDNCDVPVVTYKEVRTNGNCPNNYTLTRTWTATDACGNASSKTQVITVQDTQAPVLSAAPANVTVECDAVPAAPVLTATDNCDAPVVTFKEVRTNGNCPSNYTLTRTWTATDACGNTSTKTQVITVQDTQAPVLSAAPANVTVECDAVPAPAVLTATDNCDTPVVTYKEVRTNGNCPSNYTLTRTWTATDACGNASSKTQVITVQDTQAPVLSAAPANVTVECDAVPTPAVLTATDNCDVPVVTYKEVRTNGNCPNNYTLTRTWTATDACGNVSSKTQVITVQDTQAPVLSAAPANVTVECDAVPAAAMLTATDNCSTAAVVYNEVRTNGSSQGNYTLTRTWTATDACGNSSSKMQVITVRDTKSPVPVIASLPTLTGDCSVSATAPTALDNCAGIITATTLNPTSYTSQGVYTITWSYADGNGNVSTQLQRVVVKDLSGPIPTVAMLPAVTGQCSASVTTKPTATDACTGVTAQGTTTDPLTYTVQGVYTVHWTYTDMYGNKTYQNQQVIVKDDMAPVPNVATLPTIAGQCSVNITMVNSTRCTDNCLCCRNVCHCRNSECNCRQWSDWIATLLGYFFGSNNDDNHGCDHDDDLDDVNNLKMQAPTATDNCKGIIVGTTTDPLTYSTQGSFTIHWKFDDGNGNVTVQNQTVTVSDVEAPVPNAGSLPTVRGTCSAIVTSKPTATDNCKGTIIGTTTDPLSYTSQGTFTIHWIFDDGNGNTSTQIQTVIVQDNSKPQLTEPRDITIQCGTSTLPSATGMATATDNCGTPVITYTDVINGNRITRTWKATDAAGNYDTDIQVITLTDNTRPVITAPADITVNCGTSTLPAATGTAVATDNCSSPVITYSDYTTSNRITRTWKATDASGNYSTDVQLITIVDNVKPTITVPSNVTISCNGSTSPSVTGGSATGTDACSSVAISYTDNATGNVITRTWKATDASGNFVTGTQLITMVDNVKPVISDVRDVTISCGSSTAPSACGGTPNASDNCSVPTVTYSDAITGNIITRTWKAVNAAGNYATSTQVITIVDNTKPVITDVADIIVNCGVSTLPSVTGTATATDACSTPVVTYTDVTNGNVISRTWKATDAAGNFSTSMQTITVGSPFSAALSSVPASNTYTGGVSTNLYMGYGAQSTTLAMCSLPSSGAPYIYSWSGSAGNRLSSTTTASPVFTPSVAGYYTFSVIVTNKYGCTSTASISICVTDIRVAGTSGSSAKVYICHTPSGKNKTPQTLQVLVSQVPSHLGSGYSCGSDGNDRLGSCDQSPCAATTVNATVIANTGKVTTEEGGNVTTTQDELKVTVMPNPSTTYFTLKLESKYETPVNMRVMDANGRVIDARSKIGPNSTIQIGHNYSSGTYYAELIQGTQRKVIQMIKGRG